MHPFNRLACQVLILIFLALELVGHIYYAFHERPEQKPKRWAGVAGTLWGMPLRFLIFLSAGAFTEIFTK